MHSRESWNKFIMIQILLMFVPKIPKDSGSGTTLCRTGNSLFPATAMTNFIDVLNCHQGLILLTWINFNPHMDN